MDWTDTAVVSAKYQGPEDEGTTFNLPEELITSLIAPIPLWCFLILTSRDAPATEHILYAVVTTAIFFVLRVATVASRSSLHALEQSVWPRSDRRHQLRTDYLRRESLPIRILARSLETALIGEYYGLFLLLLPLWPLVMFMYANFEWIAGLGYDPITVTVNVSAGLIVIWSEFVRRTARIEFGFDFMIFLWIPLHYILITLAIGIIIVWLGSGF